MRQFLPFLIHNRRLESYATTNGFRRVLEIMSRYTSLPDFSDEAWVILNENYIQIGENFQNFMTEIIIMVNEEFGVELEKPVSITLGRK